MEIMKNKFYSKGSDRNIKKKNTKRLKYVGIVKKVICNLNLLIT